jgi:hypothetical protein
MTAVIVVGLLMTAMLSLLVVGLSMLHNND